MTKARTICSAIVLLALLAVVWHSRSSQTYVKHRRLAFRVAAPASTNSTARPESDTITNTWTTTPYFSKIDEPVIGADGTTVVSDGSPTSDEPLVCKASETKDPAASGNHVLRMKSAKATSAGANYDIICELRQGYVSEVSQGTLIAGVTNLDYADTDLRVDTWVLTSAQADAITDYSALSFRMYGVKNGGGANRDVQIDCVEFEVEIISGGGGQMLASDDFNRANANPIGGDWTTVTSENNYEIISNAVVPDEYYNDCTAYNVEGQWGADQYARATIFHDGVASGIGPGLAVRCSTSARTYYGMVVWQDGVELRKFVTGTFTSLKNISHTWTTGDEWELRVKGTDLSCYHNGSFVTNVSDSSISGAQGGAGLNHSSVAVDGSMDDWEGGTPE